MRLDAKACHIGAKHLTWSSYTSQGGGHGGKDAILLPVYSQATTTAFTTTVLKACKGSTIYVAGTQHRNGFTGLKDLLIDGYVWKELLEFKKIVWTPLPCFASKDEALCVFETEDCNVKKMRKPCFDCLAGCSLGECLYTTAGC